MKNLKTTFLRAAARRARAWADSVLNKIESGEQDRALQSPETFSEDGKPQLAQESEGQGLPADRRISGGPPPHWIERIRQAAPELLEYFNTTQPLSQTDDEAEKPGHEAAQQPRSSARSRAQKNLSRNTPRARPTEATGRGKSSEAFRDDSIKAEAAKLEFDSETSATASEKIPTPERAAENTEAGSAIEESRKRSARFNDYDESSKEISLRRLIESYEAHPQQRPERPAHSKNLRRDSKLEALRLFDKPKEKAASSLAESSPPHSIADQKTARQRDELRRADRSQRAESQKAESQKAESQKAESQKAESQKKAALSFLQSPARSSSARRLATEISDEADNRWPELIELDSKNFRDDLLIALDERDRLRRLDDEQRGELWSA